MVLVCGSTEWTQSGPIRARLRLLPRGTKVISGMARGADRIAAEIADGMGFEVIEMPAFWRTGGTYNPKAGFERNLRMLDRKPDLVIAFWNGVSGGTQHTIDNARRRGIDTEIVYPDDYMPSVLSLW